MAFLLTHLAQAVYGDLGRVPKDHQFLATGGSATTIVNSAWSIRENAPEDNYAIDYNAIVVRDAGGAGVSPEGKIARVTAYVASTYTYTIESVTDAIASGDTILMADAKIPISEMYRAANRALKDMGEVESVNTSFTLNGSWKYALPAGTKREYPIKVEHDNASASERMPIGFEVTADGYLYIPSDPSDGTQLYITTIGPHSDLTAYNSSISEYIHPQLAIAATEAYVLQWLNGTINGGDDYWRQRENKAWTDLEIARVRYPVRQVHPGQNWFTIADKMTYPGDPTALWS